MNLLELKESVDIAIESAIECGENPAEITVSIQVEKNQEAMFSSDVEAHYDGDGCASGYVIVGHAPEGGGR